MFEFALISRDKVNVGRQSEIDIFKALCILIMVIDHVGYYCTLDVMNNAPYVIDFLDFSSFGASGFMMCMGMSMMFTKKNSPKDFLIRGLYLSIGGYLLNFLRDDVPYLITVCHGYPFSFVDFIHALIEPDIMIFAGLAFILISFFKKINIPYIALLFISVYMNFIGYWIGDCTTGNLFFDCLFAAFIPNRFTYFPLITWFVFPVFGLGMGYLLSGAKNKTKYYLYAIPVGLFLSLILIINSEWAHNEYLFNAYPSSIIGYAGLFIVAMGVFYFISLVLPNKVMAVIKYLSQNINKIYIISWLIVGLMAETLFYIPQVDLGLIALGFIGFGVWLISVGLSLFVNYKKQKKIIEGKAAV